MGGQEPWVASDLAVGRTGFAEAEAKVGEQEEESGLPRPQSLCRGSPDLEHSGHSDQGKKEGEAVNLEGP